MFAGPEPDQTPHSLRRKGLLRRFAPFGAVSLLAAGLVPLIPGATPGRWFIVAFILTAAVTAVGLIVPWERIPRHVSMVVPLIAVTAAAAARAALGSHGWAYDTIVLLPIMWVALYESRLQLVVANVRRTTNRLSASEQRFRESFERAPLGMAPRRDPGAIDPECRVGIRRVAADREFVER